jgi:hypothetical protein
MPTQSRDQAIVAILAEKIGDLEDTLVMTRKAISFS